MVEMEKVLGFGLRRPLRYYLEGSDVFFEGEEIRRVRGFLTMNAGDLIEVGALPSDGDLTFDDSMTGFLKISVPIGVEMTLFEKHVCEYLNLQKRDIR